VAKAAYFGILDPFAGLRVVADGVVRVDDVLLVGVPEADALR
jgi:hypothetical protein